MEVIEGARVAVVRLAGKPVGHREVHTRFALLQRLRGGRPAQVLVHVHVRGEARGQAGADVDARKHRRAVAAKYAAEAFAECQSIDSRGRRNRGRGQLAPSAGGAGGAAFEQETRHAEQRLTQEQPANLARDLIIDGRKGTFAGFLPQQAPAQRIGRRFPETEACRTREALVDGALIGVQELVGGELVVVHDPFMAQVLPQIGYRRWVD